MDGDQCKHGHFQNTYSGQTFIPSFLHTQGRSYGMEVHMKLSSVTYGARGKRFTEKPVTCLAE